MTWGRVLLRWDVPAAPSKLAPHNHSSLACGLVMRGLLALVPNLCAVLPPTVGSMLSLQCLPPPCAFRTSWVQLGGLAVPGEGGRALQARGAHWGSRSRGSDQRGPGQGGCAVQGAGLTGGEAGGCLEVLGEAHAATGAARRPRGKENRKLAWPSGAAAGCGQSGVRARAPCQPWAARPPSAASTAQLCGAEPVSRRSCSAEIQTWDIFFFKSSDVINLVQFFPFFYCVLIYIT